MYLNIGTCPSHVGSFSRYTNINIFKLFNGSDSQFFHDSTNCKSCANFRHRGDLILFILSFANLNFPTLFISNSPSFSRYKRISISHSCINNLIKFLPIKKKSVWVFKSFYILYSLPKKHWQIFNQLRLNITQFYHFLNQLDVL